MKCPVCNPFKIGGSGWDTFSSAHEDIAETAYGLADVALKARGRA